MPKAQQQSSGEWMQVTVEKANRTGVCVEDEWLDYSRFYKGPKDLEAGWTGRIKVDGKWIMEIEGASTRRTNSSSSGDEPDIDRERLLAGISLLCAVIYCGKGADDGVLESAATRFREWIG